MTSSFVQTGRRDVTDFLNELYQPEELLQPVVSKASTMWNQRFQRDKLRRLSQSSRRPVLQFLRDRPSLVRNLQRDSPHLKEALQLAVDARGQVHACI